MATVRKRGSGARGKSTGKQSGRPQGEAAEKQGGRNRRRGGAASTDLPPNENIQKDADEVYGDTEIPARKEGSSQR